MSLFDSFCAINEFYRGAIMHYSDYDQRQLDIQSGQELDRRQSKLGPVDAVELGTLCCCEQAGNVAAQMNAMVEQAAHAPLETAAEHVPNDADEQQLAALTEQAEQADRDVEYARELAEHADMDRDYASMRMSAEAYLARCRRAGIVPTVREAAALAWLML